MGTVSAADTHALAVGAVVLSKNRCMFTNKGPSTLAFGAIDPSAIVDQTASVTTTFRCTGASPVATFQVSMDGGLFETAPGAPRMRHASDTTRFLPYTLDVPRIGSAPRNVVQSLTVTGTLRPAAFENAPAGTYADAVTLTLAP